MKRSNLFKKAAWAFLKIAGLFTWGCTIVGSAIVFFFKHISRKLLDIMMGFAAGTMIFVVVEELIPDSQTNGNTDVAASVSWLALSL